MVLILGSIFINNPMYQLEHNKNKNILLQWNDQKCRYIKKKKQTWKGEENKKNKMIVLLSDDVKYISYSK